MRTLLSRSTSSYCRLFRRTLLNLQVVLFPLDLLMWGFSLQSSACVCACINVSGLFSGVHDSWTVQQTQIMFRGNCCVVYVKSAINLDEHEKNIEVRTFSPATSLRKRWNERNKHWTFWSCHVITWVHRCPRTFFGSLASEALEWVLKDYCCRDSDPG